MIDSSLLPTTNNTTKARNAATIPASINCLLGYFHITLSQINLLGTSIGPIDHKKVVLILLVLTAFFGILFLGGTISNLFTLRSNAIKRQGREVADKYYMSPEEQFHDEIRSEWAQKEPDYKFNKRAARYQNLSRKIKKALDFIVNIAAMFIIGSGMYYGITMCL